MDILQIDYFDFLSAQKCGGREQEQQRHCLEAHHISIVRPEDGWRNIPVTLIISWVTLVSPGNFLYLLNKGSKTASIPNVVHCEDA